MNHPMYPGCGTRGRWRANLVPAIFVAACGICLSFAVSTAGAGETDPSTSGQVSSPAVPDFISARPLIPDVLLDQKKVGFYWIGFPIIGYDPNTLFTAGGSVSLFENGPKDSPFFRYNAYVSKTTIAAAYSSGGASTVRFSYDAPNFRGTPWHLNIQAAYVKNDFLNYFGTGQSSLQPLNFPGSNLTYRSYDAYTSALNEIHNGQTYAYYDKFRQESYLASLNVQYDTFGGILRPFAGLQIAYYNIGDYSGASYQSGINQTTRLRSDFNAGRIVGFDGGWNNAVKLGLTYDTRDFAPNPSRGVLAQVIGLGSLRAFGSASTYGQVKVEARGYYSPFPQPTRFVLAGRIGYLGATSNTPFYILPLAPGVDSTSTWLGGFDSLRGFQNNRFIGNNVIVANASARWWFAQTTLWNQNLAFGTSAFVDSGTVLGGNSPTVQGGIDRYKVAGGVGFLLSWNVSTVVSFDLGKSREGTLFYMGLGFPY